MKTKQSISYCIRDLFLTPTESYPPKIPTSLLIIRLKQDEGPVINYRDPIPWIKLSEQESENLLLRYAVDTIVLGMYDKYIDSIADLPAPKTDLWRAIVITIQTGDNDEVHKNFIQLVFFIPIEIHELIPSVTSYKDSLLNILKSQLSQPIDNYLVHRLRQRFELFMQLQLI